MITTKINGTLLDGNVTGYKTIKVTGRESLIPERNTISVANADGERVVSSRLPARVLTVEFVLSGTSETDFRSNLNALLKALNVGKAEFIFSDEASVYFIGEASIGGDTSEIKNGMHSTFEIYCADPFKYSTTEKVLDSTSQYWDAANKEWTNVPCGGTYKSFPKLKVTCPSTRNAQGENTNKNEYSFFGYTMGDDKILQFGDPTELDVVDVQYATKQYVNHAFTAFGVFTAESGISLASGSAYVTDYGSGSGWHGPSMTASIPFTAGDEGATNFSTTVTHKMTTKKKQYGAISIQVLDNSAIPVVIAEAFVKKKDSGTKCSIEYYANGTKYKTVKDIKVSKIKTTKIVKEAGKITITCGGKTHDNNVPSIATTKAYKIKISFYQKNSSTTLEANSVSLVTFNKNNGTYVKEVQNKFQPGDEINVDCASASVERNGDLEPSLGALGNDWERFYLIPGNNTIAVYYNGWKNGGTPDSPDFVLSYRERFL